MSNRLLFSLLGLLWMNSCQTIPDQYSGDPAFADTESLSAEIINASFLFDFPRQILHKDTLLIIRDVNAVIDGDACHFHIFSNKGSHLGSFGRRGRGPGELLESTTLTLAEDGWVYAYDPLSQKIIGYNLNMLSPIGQYEFKEFDLQDVLAGLSEPQAYTRITDILHIPEQQYLVIGNNDKLRFGIYAENARVKSIWNEYPRLTERGTPAEFWSVFSSSGKARLSPDGTKLACGTYIGAVLECFFIDSLQMSQSGIRKIYQPRYDIFPGVSPVQITRNDQTVIGFEDIYPTNRYIYTLLSGCSQQDYRYPNRIAVFDWSGNPVRSYQTDRQLCKLAVDEEHGVIYALTAEEEKECELVAFELPAEYRALN